MRKETAAVWQLLKIGNVVAWYYAFGCNAIAMQTFSNDIFPKEMTTSSNGLDSMSFTKFANRWILILGVTACQLLAGAVLGRALMFTMNAQTSWRQVLESHWWPLSFLHAMGSLSTNLGFLYGKASLVQLIKLLEPFETLWLSQIFFREKQLTKGTVAAMTIVISGATSLFWLSHMSKPAGSNVTVERPNYISIVFCLVSGFTLSCRNVLQRKHHHIQHVKLLPTKTSSSFDAASSSLNDGAISTSPTRIGTSSSFQELEKSLVQFTQLSLFSGIWTAFAVVLFCLVRWLIVDGNSVPHHGLADEVLQWDGIQAMSMHWPVLIWHPLYNFFSMVTLGFSSALTHSLLNAMKRIVAISWTMIKFQEGLLEQPAKLLSLVVVALGGLWYSWEMASQDKRDAMRQSLAKVWGPGLLKPWPEHSSASSKTTAQNRRALVQVLTILAIGAITMWQLLASTS